MTVAELIAKLEKMPPSHEVIMEQGYCVSGWARPVEVQPDETTVMVTVE